MMFNIKPKGKEKDEDLQCKVFQILNLSLVENDNNWKSLLRQKLKKFNLSDSKIVADGMKRVKFLSDFHRICEKTFKNQHGGNLLQEINRSYAKSAIFQRFIESFLDGNTQKVIQTINENIVEAEFKSKLKTVQRICQMVQDQFSTIKGIKLNVKTLPLIEKISGLFLYHAGSHNQKIKQEQDKTLGSIGTEVQTRNHEANIKELQQQNRKLEQQLKCYEIDKKNAQNFNASVQNQFINLENKLEMIKKSIGSILREELQCDQSLINRDQDQLLKTLKLKIVNLKQERQMIYSQNISLMEKDQKSEAQIQGKIRQNSDCMQKLAEMNDQNERLKGLLANTELQNKIQLQEITKLKADLQRQRNHSKNREESLQSNLQLQSTERFHDLQLKLQQETGKALKYWQDLAQMAQCKHRLQQIIKHKQAECCDYVLRLAQSVQKINDMQTVYKGLSEKYNKLQQKASIMTKNEELHKQRLETITKELESLTKNYQEQQIRCKTYQSQIETLKCTIQNSSLRLNEFTLLQLEKAKIQQSLTHLQEQYKLLKTSYDLLQKKEKKAVDDYEEIVYQCKGKDTQIENLKLTLEMNQSQNNSMETLKKIQTLQDRIVQLEKQNSDFLSQIRTLTRENTVQRQQIREKQQVVSKLQTKIKETTSILSNRTNGHNNNSSSNQKAQQEMSIALTKEIQMKLQSQLSQFKRFFCSQSKKQYRQLMQRNDIQKSNYTCMLYIDRFFQGEMLQEKIQYKLRLLAHIYRLTGLVVAKTHLIYRMDFKNKTNFHEYIDKTSSLMLVVKTNSGAYVAGYYTGEYGAHPMTEPATLISITNNQSYTLNVPQNGSKSSYRAMVYDPYFLIFGNAELRIKAGEKTVFSNFGIMNSYYNSRGKKVHDLLCEEGTRETGIESYEIYQILFDYDYVDEQDDYHKY